MKRCPLGEFGSERLTTRITADIFARLEREKAQSTEQKALAPKRAEAAFAHTVKEEKAESASSSEKTYDAESEERNDNLRKRLGL